MSLFNRGLHNISLNVISIMSKYPPLKPLDVVILCGLMCTEDDAIKLGMPT